MSSHTRLFVGNVPENTQQNNLQEAFSSYGQVINVDLKSKSNAESDHKKFAFITISGSHYEIESCIKHFSIEDFCGSRLYVTRARESFLERLQRERNDAHRKESDKNEHTKELPKKDPVIKLGDKLNPRKRKFENQPAENKLFEDLKVIKHYEKKNNTVPNIQNEDRSERKDKILSEKDKKKTDSDRKRLESMKKKRQEFREKKMIIKTGLGGVDKVANKKVIFSDSEENSDCKTVNGFKKRSKSNQMNSLFEGDESGDEVNFEIKKQFEGKQGQKVLDLQSRYKSDKRFTLDERFIEDIHSEDNGKTERADEDETVDLGDADEKTKQLTILQDVLGVAIRTKPIDFDSRKTKAKVGMLRFDPMQPEHAKFLVPLEKTKEDQSKKSKEKKLKGKNNKEQNTDNVEADTEKVQVSKEQFYNVSETLKNALVVKVQPSSFSLRSLFGHIEDKQIEATEPAGNIKPLEKPKDSKMKNPLDPSGRNPFVYDSSDSEDDEPQKEVKNPDLAVAQSLEVKAVWKENLFFSKSDNRLQEGLAFFNKPNNNEAHKERRELKSVMKKRIYNKERKNQMFQKKIGGRKKSMKKSYNRIKS